MCKIVITLCFQHIYYIIGKLLHYQHPLHYKWKRYYITCSSYIIGIVLLYQLLHTTWLLFNSSLCEYINRSIEWGQMNARSQLKAPNSVLLHRSCIENNHFYVHHYIFHPAWTLFPMLRISPYPSPQPRYKNFTGCNNKKTLSFLLMH